MLDYKGTGMSVMEISHRSKEFEAIVTEAQTDLRDLMGIPANYKILFLQGGASLQFAMVPMNFRPAGAVLGLYRHRHMEQEGFQGIAEIGNCQGCGQPGRRITSTTCRPSQN